MIHLFPVSRIPNRGKIGTLDPEGLVGERVSVHYNLNRCRPGKPPKADETCYVVRDKPSGKTRGYVDEIALADVETLIRPGALGRIRKREQREVCCFIRGTVVPMDEVEGDLLQGGFNPFRQACFYLRDDGMCVDAADFVVFSGRDFWFVDPVVSDPDEAEARIPNAVRKHERKVGDRVLDKLNQRRWGYIREFTWRPDGVPTYLVWWSDHGIGGGWTDYDLVTPKPRGRGRRRNNQIARRLKL